MKTTWKYTLQVTDTQTVAMPRGAQVLCVQMQDGDPQLWAVVDSEAPLSDRTFDTYGTGKKMQGHPYIYVGTYQMHSGALVFHVFERP